jgi:hypothetical protein
MVGSEVFCDCGGSKCQVFGQFVWIRDDFYRILWPKVLISQEVLTVARGLLMGRLTVNTHRLCL